MKLDLNLGEGINTKKECSVPKKGLKLSLSAGKRLSTGMRHSLAEIGSKNDLESQSSDYVTMAEKSSLNQKKSLEHSRKQTKDEIVVKSGANAEIVSSVDETKALDSMEYGDFIAQLTQQNEQQGSQSEKLSGSQDKEDKKQTMSYSEFLGMFKPPPKNESSKPLEDETEAVSPISIINETKKEIKYKSVTSYFSKAEKMSSETITIGPRIMTVTAEIHSPSQAMSDNKQTNAYTKKLPRNTTKTCAVTPIDEIVILGSETITDVQVNSGKKSLSIKRRNNETVHSQPQIFKKMKIDSPETSKKEIVEIPLEKCGKVKTSQLKMFKTTKTHTVCAEAVVPTTAQTLQPLAVKTSQSTLCFGKSGFSLTKAAEANKDIGVNEKSSETQKEDKGLTRRLSSRRGQTDTEAAENGVSLKEKIVKDGEIEEKHKSQDTREQSKKSDPSATSQVSTEDIQEETDTSVEIVEHTNGVTGGLRRSARLTQSAKSLDVVEIGSDSEDEVGASKIKKRRLGGTPKALLASDNSAASSLKKMAGKLAPVFTLMKPKQPVERSVTTMIDPEQDRLRREFLMSGIPDELKRQISTTATANVLLDYPPFPRVSHVQQLQESSCPSATGIIPRLACTFDECPENVHGGQLIWKNLGWDHIPTNAFLYKDVFQNFFGNSQFQDFELDILLKELQSKHEKFPFRQTYMELHSKVITLEASSCEVAGNKAASNASDDMVVVDDDDDVVVVDDSVSASEKLVLNHTSEPKASLWSDLHQPDSSAHVIGNTKAIKQLKHWLEEWRVLIEQQERKTSRISRKANKKKSKGGWTDDSDFTDSEEEEMTLCNSVLVTGPHGVGKTASVYALAKELGFKVFEVNSSSLRSGKQLLAQLEEATQSHRVAQTKTKSPVFLDTPLAGTPSTEIETGKDVRQKSKQKPVASANLAFANLFRIAAPKAESTSTQSGKAVKGKQQTLAIPEAKSKNEEPKRKSDKQSNLKSTESAPTKASRGKKNEDKEEMAASKCKKNNNNKEEVCDAVIKKKKGAYGKQSGGVEVKPQTIGDYNATSGSLNLTSASLILFDEVDVVFEEDKGFLATVQHFMESTKIPIVLTSTDLSFHLQLHARHEHISFLQPPLISTASFLSTVCLAHGVRVDHQSVVNVLRHVNGDVRRCLLCLQFWCESAGGLVRVQKGVDPKSWPVPAASNHSVDVVMLKKDNYSKKKFYSKNAGNDDSSDCEFISLRPLKKKTRRVISDEDDSSHDSTICNTIKSAIKSKEVNCGSQRSRSKSTDITLYGDENKTVKLLRQIDELPLLHLRLEESLLGLCGCDISAATVGDLIQAPTLSCHGLAQAVQVCSTIRQALSIDAIHHTVLHCLPLPKTDIQITQLVISSQQKPPSAQIVSCKKPRKRIIQGDWLDSDNSDEDLDNFRTQNPAKDDEGNVKCGETSSLKSNSEKELPSRCRNNDGVTESGKKKTGSKLMVPVLSDFARFFDNLSVIDHLETWSHPTTHFTGGLKLIPGLSDDETHSTLDASYFDDQLHHMGTSMRVLAARKFCSSVGDHVNSFKKHCCDPASSGETHNVQDSTENVTENYTSGLSDLPDEFHLPVKKELPDFWNIADKVQSQSDPALKNIIKSLSPAVSSSKSSLHLDYMPYLREICRVENERHLAKSQRRFHHYLDNIGLGLKESTIASLASTFVVSPDGSCDDL